MNKRNKQIGIFWTGFFLTLIIAAAFLAFLIIDHTLQAAGFGGMQLTDSILRFFNRVPNWISRLGEAAKTAYFFGQALFQQLWKEWEMLLQNVISMI